MAENELYYQSLADIYITEYQNDLKLTKKVLVAKGVLTSMYSEMLSYRVKNGSNEKLKKQEARLDILEDVFEAFSAIQTRNLEYRLLAREKNRQLEQKDAVIAELQRQIEILNKQLEAI